MGLSLAKEMDNLFKQIFDVNLLNRSPLIFSTDENSVTTFDLKTDDVFKLNQPTSGSAKSLINDIKNNKSGIQRSFLALLIANRMNENKTLATQILSLYLNNSLIELTKTLGSSIVTDKKNDLVVEFYDSQDYAAVEMRVILKIKD